MSASIRRPPSFLFFLFFQIYQPSSSAVATSKPPKTTLPHSSQLPNMFPGMGGWYPGGGGFPPGMEREDRASRGNRTRFADPGDGMYNTAQRTGAPTYNPFDPSTMQVAMPGASGTLSRRTQGPDRFDSSSMQAAMSGTSGALSSRTPVPDDFEQRPSQRKTDVSQMSRHAGGTSRHQAPQTSTPAPKPTTSAKAAEEQGHTASRSTPYGLSLNQIHSARESIPDPEPKHPQSTTEAHDVPVERQRHASTSHGRNEPAMWGYDPIMSSRNERLAARFAADDRRRDQRRRMRAAQLDQFERQSMNRPRAGFLCRICGIPGCPLGHLFQ